MPCNKRNDADYYLHNTLTSQCLLRIFFLVFYLLMTTYCNINWVLDIYAKKLT